MSAILIAVLSNLGTFLLKYLIAWGERSIAAQKALKEKMKEQQARLEQARVKGEAYEQNPNSDSRDDIK